MPTQNSDRCLEMPASQDLINKIEQGFLKKAEIASSSVDDEPRGLFQRLTKASSMIIDEKPERSSSPLKKRGPHPKNPIMEVINGITHSKITPEGNLRHGEMLGLDESLNMDSAGQEIGRKSVGMEKRG